ncbi:MAG: hypothetical protein UT63_C0083G0013 [Candidatus Gottesmanbacteria bacterium GW2011_GWC2_39_8]|uniref:Thioredoxin domain-containing protein n=1 Tax=Candidatus Gottesmanbacteria bacterium GW2011_GWC2_39_8 TaxID=1618450 RepID=A0A0G0PT93_9BACT|nr:MAG: hypothetical protein UT63_C0083G0013 [Candidatus Gottesmanbacteria bacterium GW2011_GWC2_39_8]
MKLTGELKLIVGSIIVTIGIIAGTVFFFAGGSGSVMVNTQNLIRPESPGRGDKNAKVKIVEFADFECPACGYVAPVIDQLVRDYKDKIYVVYRHFPLSQHKNAKKGAEAFEAAGEQGKYWEMSDKLYSTQSQWSDLSDPSEAFVGFAKELNLDTVKFKKDLTSEKYNKTITDGLSDGDHIGINVTPTFIINGEKVEGAKSLEEFKKIIDKILTEK